MKFFFSNVPGCKLYTWMRVVSATHGFPKNLRAVFFGTFQKSCSNYLARPIFACFYKTQSLFCSIRFSFFRRSLPFIAHLCTVSFDIPEVYLEPSQLFKIELFAKMAFRRQLYLQEALSQMFDWVLHAPSYSEHTNNHFHQI